MLGHEGRCVLLPGADDRHFQSKLVVLHQMQDTARLALEVQWKLSRPNLAVTSLWKRI